MQWWRTCGTRARGGSQTPLCGHTRRCPSQRRREGSAGGMQAPLYCFVGWGREEQGTESKLLRLWVERPGKRRRQHCVSCRLSVDSAPQVHDTLSHSLNVQPSSSSSTLYCTGSRSCTFREGSGFWPPSGH